MKTSLVIVSGVGAAALAGFMGAWAHSALLGQAQKPEAPMQPVRSGERPVLRAPVAEGATSQVVAQKAQPVAQAAAGATAREEKQVDISRMSQEEVVAHEQ